MLIFHYVYQLVIEITTLHIDKIKYVRYSS